MYLSTCSYLPVHAYLYVCVWRHVSIQVCECVSSFYVCICLDANMYIWERLFVYMFNYICICNDVYVYVHSHAYFIPFSLHCPRCYPRFANGCKRRDRTVKGLSPPALVPFASSVAGASSIAANGWPRLCCPPKGLSPAPCLDGKLCMGLDEVLQLVPLHEAIQFLPWLPSIWQLLEEGRITHPILIFKALLEQ